MIDSQKIKKINEVIGQYFETNKDSQKVPAKNLMPQFIKAGIFIKDHRRGLPIREILRELDSQNELSRIPYVFPERKTKNTYWYFVPVKAKVAAKTTTSPTKNQVVLEDKQDMEDHPKPEPKKEESKAEVLPWYRKLWEWILNLIKD